MKDSCDRPKRILIVDDEPAICQLCVRVLRMQKFDVDVASDGNAAQRMMQVGQYDVCLIDMKVPSLNGKDLYYWMAEKLPHLSSGIIFTSGDTVSKETRGFLEAVGRPFLAKPFAPGELRAVVAETLANIGQQPTNY